MEKNENGWAEKRMAWLKDKIEIAMSKELEIDIALMKARKELGHLSYRRNILTANETAQRDNFCVSLSSRKQLNAEKAEIEIAFKRLNEAKIKLEKAFSKLADRRYEMENEYLDLKDMIDKTRVVIAVDFKKRVKL